jgi:hypothetical protein
MNMATVEPAAYPQKVLLSDRFPMIIRVFDSDSETEHSIGPADPVYGRPYEKVDLINSHNTCS